MNKSSAKRYLIAFLLIFAFATFSFASDPPDNQGGGGVADPPDNQGGGRAVDPPDNQGGGRMAGDYLFVKDLWEFILLNKF